MERKGFALPVCLLSMTMMMALGIYLWKELSLTSDVLADQQKYYIIITELEASFDTWVMAIARDFNRCQHQVAHTHKIVYEAALVRGSLEISPVRKDLLLLTVQHKKTGHRIAGVIGRTPRQREPGMYYVYVDYITFGSGH